MFEGWFLRLGQKWFYFLGTLNVLNISTNTILESLQGDQERQRTSQQERGAYSQGGRHFRGKFVRSGTNNICICFDLIDLFVCISVTTSILKNIRKKNIL